MVTTMLDQDMQCVLDMLMEVASRWLVCTRKNRCVSTSFTGTTSQALYFNRCTHERLYIYAHGCQTGDIIYSGDVIMIVQENRAVSIQGINHGAYTSMSYYCPGSFPPAYDAYSYCSSNVFRVYKI